MNEIYEPYKLIQNIVDATDDLIIIIEKEKPILMNQACCRFFGVSSFEEYTKNFGDFVNSSVPSYLFQCKQGRRCSKLVSDIKACIRENDILVKYSSHMLLLAYLNQPLTLSNADSNVLSCGFDSIPKDS